MPRAISWGLLLLLVVVLEEGLLEEMMGTELEAVVDDWVVAVEEGVGSRALRLGAIFAVSCRVEERDDGWSEWSWILKSCPVY